MARSNFAGPITAGNIRDTSGNTVGVDVSNSGFAVLAQVAQITQSATAAPISIVIPANSAIIGIQSYAETDFTGPFSVGTTNAALDIATDANCAAGVSPVSAQTDVEAMVWKNVGPKDVQLWVKSQSNGIGVGYLVVTYAQAINAY
jgi:hypothetical protein